MGSRVPLISFGAFQVLSLKQQDTPWNTTPLAQGFPSSGPRTLREPWQLFRGAIKPFQIVYLTFELIPDDAIYNNKKTLQMVNGDHSSTLSLKKFDSFQQILLILLF